MGTPEQAIAQAQQRIANDMAKLQTQYSQLVAQVAKTSNDPNNQPFITITNTKDFDLEIKENGVFRKMYLPFEYDDEGNVKTYTKEEKDALRGDDKTKPGYAAKSRRSRRGPGSQALFDAAARKRKRTRTPTRTRKKTKKPRKSQRPTINMIVLTKDNPTTHTRRRRQSQEKEEGQ